jgi:hypothetical protein
MAMIIVAPAMAAVTISAVEDGTDPTAFTLEWAATGADADVTSTYSLISGMAINVSISAGTMDILAGYKTDGESTNASPGYGIYPGSIVFDAGSNMTSSGDPIAPAADPGALGDLPGQACTVEAGALFDADAVPSDEPLASGVICKFKISGLAPLESSTVSLAAESVHRKGIVMRDGNAPSSLSFVGVVLTEPGASYPACWDNDAQCKGDATGEGDVGLLDFNDLRDAWSTTKDVDVNYDPCADFNRDGAVGLLDFNILRDNWSSTPVADCVDGDPLGIYP